MITSQTRNHQATEPTMKNSRFNTLLALKCKLLFQMTEQSYPSLFTLTIGFIPISIKRLLCNLDYKPVSSEKLALAVCAVQGPFRKSLRATLFSANCFIEVQIVDMINDKRIKP